MLKNGCILLEIISQNLVDNNLEGPNQQILQTEAELMHER